MAGRSGLRAAHFFKKLPRDITEGTWVGGVVSMVGVVVALALAASITQSYRSVSIKTEVLLDTASARHIELTFNVTMERLPCRFTSIDAFDATGTKKLNITEAIRMQRISSEDGHVLSDKEEEVWTDEPDFDGSEDGEDAGSEDGEDAGSGDSLGMPKPGSVLELSVVPGGGPWVPQPKAAAAPCVDEQESCQAWAKDGQCIANPAFMRAKCQKSCNVCTPTADTQDAQPPAGARDFDTFVAGRELVLVAFGAPWCPWSQKLGPVWDSVYERMREDDVLSETVDLARVDCTQPASRPLCANQSIRAFPTVRVYRAHNAHSHEEYAGERSVDEILLFLHDAVDMHE
jgi:thiol-disulfide isomerase/thioredoxin